MGEEFKASLLDRVGNAITTFLMGLETTCIGEASYEEVMKFFFAHKNDDPRIVKGALSCKKDGAHTVLIQIFLDKEEKVVCTEKGIPIGRRLKVSTVDEELLNAFKQTNLLVVE
jgi:hypothetical protein